MRRIDPFAAGLTLGLLMGAAHAAGLIFGGQLVRATFEPAGVDVSVAAFLVVMTIFAGCAMGWLFAAIWNGLATQRPPGPVQQALQ